MNLLTELEALAHDIDFEWDGDNNMHDAAACIRALIAAEKARGTEPLLRALRKWLSLVNDEDLMRGWWMRTSLQILIDDPAAWEKEYADITEHVQPTHDPLLVQAREALAGCYECSRYEADLIAALDARIGGKT